MADMFGYTDGWMTSGIDWNSPVYSVIGTPNSGSVAVNTPSVDTGGASWASWFDRIVGAGLALRASSAKDATITAYPGGSYGVSQAGQPAMMSGSGFSPVLILAGLALAALFVLKD